MHIHSVISLFISATVPKNLCHIRNVFTSIYTCDINDLQAMQELYSQKPSDKCKQLTYNQSAPTIFLFYDVNPVEGFNLRRDVYIRMAVFTKFLQSQPGFENVKLVLPPFYQLYHWQINKPSESSEILFWNHFFDLSSLKKYTQVIDIWEYFEIMNECFGHKKVRNYKLDYVFKLTHFASMFSSGKFEEKYEIGKVDCEKERRRVGNQFINLYSNFTIENFHCTEFQGSASLLHDLFKEYVKSSRKYISIAILNAETVLHDHWADKEFWTARRSMRFNKIISQIANEYRQSVLNSTDNFDEINRPDDWRDENEPQFAQGGKYLCAHLRRADFLHGREKTTPTLHSAAIQIKKILKETGMRVVFISSDCTGHEYKDLKSYLPRCRVVKFTPSSSNQRMYLKSGGIAIVDQIICSYAEHFIGTYESTFTYRIYEEREILGFAREKTFNTFCKNSDDSENCQRNPVWPIVY